MVPIGTHERLRKIIIIIIYESGMNSKTENNLSDPFVLYYYCKTRRK